MATTPLLRIGTRGSPLALAQADELRQRLAATHPELAAPDAIQTIIIQTTGDRVTDRALSAIGGKGLFTKEIEQALLDGAIDLAVHSMKDVPTQLPDGLVIDGFLPREDPRDALFSASGATLDTLPAGAVIGTSSLRRQAQILNLRPDLRVVPFRGNVQTRLRKLEEGVVDATILALAGLRRLKLTDGITSILPPETMLPAVAQGAIGLERREDDDRVADWVYEINDYPTLQRVSAERAFLAVLDGSCQTPIAALAEVDENERLLLRCMVIRPDGTGRHTIALIGDADDSEGIGRVAGLELQERSGDGFLDFLAPDGMAS
jgi:hydroxymethylbilane synthase